MKQTKKLVISAMLVALGTVIMRVGAYLQIADLAACALASLFVVLAYIELHSPYTWLIWLSSSVLLAVMAFGSPVWSEYFLVFGLYPILKAYIERAPRWLWWPLKVGYVNAMLWVIVLVVQGIMGIKFFDTSGGFIMMAGIYVVANVAFIVYDMFLTTMVRVYMHKWRRSFVRFFK